MFSRLNSKKYQILQQHAKRNAKLFNYNEMDISRKKY